MMLRTGGRAKPQVVLSGFFGRGNCGDEALLQAQYELLSPRYDIVISVDERGARDGFWDWYPYDRCRIVHQGNLAVLAEGGVIGIHVGGGGLPHGFNAAQVVHARSLGKPAFLTGVDARPVASATAATAVGRYLELFDFVSVRSAAAWRTMNALMPTCHHGADWALALPTDESTTGPRRGGVLVTIREFPADLISRRYRGDVADLLAVLADRFGQVTLLPFCPEDERFLDHLPMAGRLPREVHWWNPRRMQRVIADADLVVSLGRLHPLVFAANVGTPAVFAEPLGHDPRWQVCTKARDLAAEHGWPIEASITDLTARLRRPEGMTLASAAFASGTRDRWRAMADALEACLAAATRGDVVTNPRAWAG
jgi:polysaccharide pyruvyl transferase WcaK-like protein